MVRMAAGYRQHISVSEEIKDMILADLVLTLAFSFAFVGGIFGVKNIGNLLYYVPIAFVAVSLSFILHEYMHKIVAQRYGAIAGFRRSDMGLLITLGTGIFGFLIGIPGATMIYTSRFTSKEEGIVSLAGPLTNFAVFIGSFVLFLLVGQHGYIASALGVTMLISVLLAYFNMLPIYPLDGSKVLRWNKPVYVSFLLVLGALLLFLGFSIFNLIYLFVIAFIFSIFYSGLRI